MTTIAANLDGMAADSFVSDGSRVTKIFRLPGPKLVGVCGHTYRAMILANWIAGGERGGVPLQLPSDVDSTSEEVLILDKNGLYTMDTHGVRLPVDLHYMAIGSGRCEANGALFIGASPEQAVEAACFHDSGSKGPVIYEPLRLPRKRK